MSSSFSTGYLISLYFYKVKIQEDYDNVAYHGTTEQSGEQSSKTGSSLAVNGNHMSCRLTENTISITDSSYNSWWQVRLHSLTQVKSVVIYNREDCCSDQLSDATIYVGMIFDEYRMTVTDRRFSNTGNMKGVKVKEFTGKGDFFGHIVKIEKKKRNAPLSLCEVEVYGKTGLNYIFIFIYVIVIAL